jgi:hypothetical protein
MKELSSKTPDFGLNFPFLIGRYGHYITAKAEFGMDNLYQKM